MRTPNSQLFNRPTPAMYKPIFYHNKSNDLDHPNNNNSLVCITGVKITLQSPTTILNSLAKPHTKRKKEKTHHIGFIGKKSVPPVEDTIATILQASS